MHPLGELVVAVIPARFGATRFPGKPLVDIAGVPMVVRVARQAAAASTIQEVLIATDDPRIAQVVEQAGFRVAMTPSDCATGSDRIAWAIRERRGAAPRLVVNVQGDEPLLDPRDLDVLVKATLADPGAIGTLARPLPDPSRFADPNVVKVARAAGGRALYFSRAPIPYGVEAPLLHVGIYAYPPEVLSRFVGLPPSPLERTERLEQLRALENGIPIQVTMCVSERPSLGVDTPEDVARVIEELRHRNQLGTSHAAAPNGHAHHEP